MEASGLTKTFLLWEVGVVLWMLKSLRSSFLVRCELVEHRSLVLDNLTEVLG